MEKTKILEGVFSLAQNGIKINPSNLPKDISKDVVEKNLLYLELKDLVKNNGCLNRINEIKQILNPSDKEEIDEEDKF